MRTRVCRAADGRMPSSDWLSLMECLQWQESRRLSLISAMVEWVESGH